MDEALRSKVQAVSTVIVETERYVEEQAYYPRATIYSDRVALALLGKSVALCRSICLLVQEDFPEEAFGLSRTLLDIAFTLRFIANKDTEERAGRYINYYSKDRVHWAKIIPNHFKGAPAQLPTDFEKDVERAKEYDSPHDWTGLKDKTRGLALEEDSREPGYTARFDYEVIYKWTSHYVHATVVSLTDDYSFEMERAFAFRPARTSPSRFSGLALFNATLYLNRILIAAFRILNDEFPKPLSDKFDEVMVLL